MSWKQKAEYGIFSLVLLLLLYWRLRLGMVRYFDIDEFAHLHWGYNFFSGMHPYRDYLYFFPPGFLFLLVPIFLIAKTPLAILATARIAAFFGFLFLCGSLWLLVRQIRDVSTAWLSVILLAFLPIPSDKFLEIRPDTVAVGCGVLSLFLLLRKRFFAAGLWLAIGLAVLPKIAFFVPAFGVVAVLLIGRRSREWGALISGLSIPAVSVVAFFFWSGDFARAVYLTTAFASDSSRVLGSKFYMFPSHFFYANDVYYGIGGINGILISNHMLYLIGILFCIIQTGYLLSIRMWNRSPGQLLIGLVLLANLYAFARIFPLKHAQYLMLVAPFVCYFAANSILFVRKKMRWGGEVILIASLGVMVWYGHLLYAVKSQWNHAETDAELATVARLIPKGEAVWDLFGETIVYKDPYYLCCIPYGQYTEAFGFPLPSLSEALQRNNGHYIFAHDRGRLSVLPPQDAQYITDHYEEIEGNPLIFRKKE